MGDLCVDLLFFFFSSRRRHTRWTGDWSSDVCSSDLDQVLDAALRPIFEHDARNLGLGDVAVQTVAAEEDAVAGAHVFDEEVGGDLRSEERRVGKSGGLGGGRVR